MEEEGDQILKWNIGEPWLIVGLILGEVTLRIAELKQILLNVSTNAICLELVGSLTVDMS